MTLHNTIARIIELHLLGLLALVQFLLFPTRAYAQDQNGDYFSGTLPVDSLQPDYVINRWQVTTPSGLNCRRDAGTEFSIVEVLTSGELFQVQTSEGRDQHNNPTKLDSRGLPWFKVTGSQNEIKCFVRANKRYIEPITQEQSSCDFEPWITYQGTVLSSHPTSSAYLFSSTHMAIDADGAPNAYHPDDVGLDFLANAGYPDASWWDAVLVRDPINPSQAYRQPDGEFAGYFVSKTSLQDTSKLETDPTRYVDARNIPYLVFPGSFYRQTGTGLLGDLGYALNLATGETSPFVVADIGPSRARLGEVSIALAEGLGGNNVNPRNGAGSPQGEMLYVVFPYSSRTHPWPLSIEDINRHASSILAEIGGIESIRTCEDSL